MILEGGGVQTLKIGGSKTKTEGQTALKSGGSSLAVGCYFKEAMPPPPNLLLG